MSEEDTLQEILRVRCWCGQWVTVADGPRGMQLLHPMPTCQRFIEEPLDEYLRNLRRHYEKDQ